MALEKNPKYTGLVYEVGENPKEKKKVDRIAVWNNLSMKEESPVYQVEIKTDSGKRYRFGLWNFKSKGGACSPFPRYEVRKMFVLNGKSEKILGLLKKCGLTEYESNAYFTLLLTDRAKMWDISKKSSVPQSKVYWVVEGLRDKGLVDVDEEMSKTAMPRRFGTYLRKAINEKQREISNLIESGNSIRDTIYGLRPVAIKYRNKYRVSEPKYRRKNGRCILSPPMASCRF